MKYLLHARTIADFLQGQPHVLARLKSTPPVDVGIASVSVLEIRYGFICHPDLSIRTEAVFNALVAATQVVDFTHDDAVEAARVLAECRSNPDAMGIADAQICAMARRRDLTLIVASPTNADHPYQSVNGLRILDWGLPAI